MLEPRQNRQPPGAAVEDRRDEITADCDAREDRGEHDGEAIDGGPQEERQDAEPDHFERQRDDAGHREHDKDQPKLRVSERGGESPIFARHVWDAGLRRFDDGGR